MVRSPRRRLAGAVVATALAIGCFASRALAHAGHPRHGGTDAVGLPGVLFLLGGVLVVTGLGRDRADDVPGEYVRGLVLGGAGLVLVIAPVLWFV